MHAFQDTFVQTRTGPNRGGDDAMRRGTDVSQSRWREGLSPEACGAVAKPTKVSGHVPGGEGEEVAFP